jgi:hypothetical protein
MSVKQARGLLLAATGLLPIISFAGGNVTACHTDTETGSGTNLTTALSGGGDVFIRCPSGTRLPVTHAYNIVVPTQIIGAPTDSGSAQITLQASGIRRTMLLVRAGARLTVQNLGFSNFKSVGVFLFVPVGVIPGSAGAIAAAHMPDFFPTIISSDSDVELDHVTIDTSRDSVGVNGNLTVTGSTFRDNAGTTLVANGTVAIDHSNFSQNQRGVLLGAGNIAYSQFDHNTERAVDILFPQGTVTVRDSTFSANTGIAVAVSAQSSPNGGGSVLLRNNTFDNNNSATAGPVTIATETLTSIPATDPRALALAHLPAGNIQVLYSSFNSNSGAAGALQATLRINQDKLDLGGDAFLRNRSTLPADAALTVKGGLVTLSHALFKANTAVQASAIAADPIAQLTVSNSLIVEGVSSASAADAAAISAVFVTLSNVTIANNQGTGVRATVTLPVVALAKFSNVILANNARACEFGSGMSVEGANLVFPDDHSCPGATILEDPVLDSFYIPSPGSPALTQGDTRVCAGELVGARDIVFQKRTDQTCALGAFERPPPRFFGKPTPDGLAQLGRAGQQP